MRTSTKVEVRKAKIGKGIFSKKILKAGSVILEIKGKIIHWEKLNDIGGNIQDNAFRFGENTYLSPEGEMGSFLNHSCAPNCRITKSKGKLYAVALKDILPNKEVVFDYSTILGDDDIWEMSCKCGAKGCRKRIRKFGSLPKKTREKYIDACMVPSHILLTL